MTDLDITALESKLNAVRDRRSEDPISRPASPLLASTSSEALQYHAAVCRKPLTEEELAERHEERKQTLNLFLGDEPTRRMQDEQFKQEREALRNLAMRGWGICEAYETESSRIAAHRVAEDGSKNISTEEYTPTWTENDQRALEFERQKKDYLQLEDQMSVFLDGDAESEDFATSL